MGQLDEILTHLTELAPDRLIWQNGFGARDGTAAATRLFGLAEAEGLIYHIHHIYYLYLLDTSHHVHYAGSTMETAEVTQDMAEQHPLMQVREAARALGIHENTLRRWQEAGRIRAVKLPTGVRRFRPEDIDRLRKDIYRDFPYGVESERAEAPSR